MIPSKPIQLKDWVPSEPNRETRRKLEKEISKLKPLLNIDSAFQKAALETDVDYDLILGFYKGEYKKTAELLLSQNRFECFDIIENFIELKYGYDKEKVKKYDNKVQILEPIRNFVNRFK
jgi:hypothetical protein